MSNSNDLFGGKLFNKFPSGKKYAENEKLQAHLFGQYKLYVEMADRVSSRRHTANSYFLTVNTALLSFVGYIAAKETSDYLWLLGVVGVVLCYLWYRLISSYGDLNTVKFTVIHAIEKKLPISPYDAEWEAAGRGNDPKKYKPFTHIERRVPWVFMILHLFVFLRTFNWKIIF